MLEGSPVVAGGAYNREERYFEPTIVYPASWSAPIMETEIFGPILPIMTYTDLDPVLDVVRRRPRSLAAYIFSADERIIDRFVHGFAFGGGAVNETIVQCFINSMPFGGVGASGVGRYYGKYGFDSLSHAKSILMSPIDMHIDAVLPPYTEEKAAELGEWFGLLPFNEHHNYRSFNREKELRRTVRLFSPGLKLPPERRR